MEALTSTPDQTEPETKLSREEIAEHRKVYEHLSSIDRCAAFMGTSKKDLKIVAAIKAVVEGRGPREESIAEQRKAEVAAEIEAARSEALQAAA